MKKFKRAFWLKLAELRSNFRRRFAAFSQKMQQFDRIDDMSNSPDFLSVGRAQSSDRVIKTYLEIEDLADYAVFAFAKCITFIKYEI